MSVDIIGIKALRQRTAAGVMDCNRALFKSDGDVEAAVQLLQRPISGEQLTFSMRLAGS